MVPAVLRRGWVLAAALFLLLALGGPVWAGETVAAQAYDSGTVISQTHAIQNIEILKKNISKAWRIRKKAALFKEKLSEKGGEKTGKKVVYETVYEGSRLNLNFLLTRLEAERNKMLYRESNKATGLSKKIQLNRINDRLLSTDGQKETEEGLFEEKAHYKKGKLLQVNAFVSKEKIFDRQIIIKFTSETELTVPGRGDNNCKGNCAQGKRQK